MVRLAALRGNYRHSKGSEQEQSQPKQIIMKTILTCIAVGCLAYSCNSPKTKEVAKEEIIETETPVARGEYLVNVLGCHDCHSPKTMTPDGPVPDPARLLSGFPSDQVLAQYDMETAKSYVLFSMDLTSATGPWGTSFAANLTPDETGIGSWSEDQFLKALKQGKWKGMDGARQLLPPMPWQGFAHLPDEDVLAIFAYLKSIQPVDNVVPLPIPPRI
jgi:hypothetical protein